ncbi:MAG: 50S ribosomal protein L17 [Bacteroidota bacterium]
MKHGKKILKIGRNASHRKATLQSMSAALIEHKRITTTFGKAKALRRFVEPIITKSKDDSTHARRQVFRKLNDKEAVKTLYAEVATVVGDRPGGYTRIVKLGQRGGDAAEMAVVELVDFNDIKPDGSSGPKRKTRRSRRRSGGGAAAAAPAAEAAPEVIEPADEAPASETEETAAEVEAAPEADAPEAEEIEAAADTEEAPVEDAPEAEEAPAEAPAAEAPAAEAEEAAPEAEAPEADAASEDDAADDEDNR